MKSKNILAVLSAFAAAVLLSGCAVSAAPGGDEDQSVNDSFLEDSFDEPESEGNNNGNSENNDNELVVPPQPTLPEDNGQPPDDAVVKPVEPENKPAAQTVFYLKVTADGVNMRSGAGTNYSVKGTAEKNTLYAYSGESDGWYKTHYKNADVYISKKYCVIVEMQKNENEKVEKVIEQGTKLLGTKYVYGAIRYHNGNGVKLSGFKISEFDCSSLMQYMFYHGADVMLSLTTRTQVVQGKTVSKSNLKRGDLMFFTNANRKDKVGVERIGHVALYLGDNLILHTASDYAKIEQISSVRWGYYVQSQRMI